MKNKFYLLIIPIIIFVGLSFWQFLTIDGQQNEEAFVSLDKQISLCEKSIEDKVSDFEESANYDFAERTYQIFLNSETARIPLDIKNKYIIKEKSRIKTFYLRHKVLISRIEIYNQTVQRTLKNNNGALEVSETQPISGNKTLYSEPQLIENKSSISYIQPVHEPGGKLVANLQFYLKLDDFLASQFDKFYIGKNTWQWAIDSVGSIVYHKSCDEQIDELFETEAVNQFRVKLLDNESISLKHTITTDKKEDVYSVFCPVSFFNKKIGIIFSAKTDDFWDSQKIPIYTIFVYFLTTIIVITILFIVILNLFYRKK